MCVHFRYGLQPCSSRSFSWKLARHASVLARAFHPLHAFGFRYPDLPGYPLPRLHRLFRPPAHACLLRHSLALAAGAGLSSCCPSATPLGLALGPDFPRADEPSSGILGPSVCGILTRMPLLTPAFSLPCAPHALPVMLPRSRERSPTIFIHSFGIMLSPGIFSAQSHSTSELLRTLSRMAASEPTSWLSGHLHILFHLACIWGP